jgi:hypothetical protein
MSDQFVYRSTEESPRRDFLLKTEPGRYWLNSEPAHLVISEFKVSVEGTSELTGPILATSSMGSDATILLDSSTVKRTIVETEGVIRAGSLVKGVGESIIREKAMHPEDGSTDSPALAHSKDLVKDQKSDSALSSSPIKTTEHAVDWVGKLSWVVPRHLREPVWGDLCEDRLRMASRGCSQSQIEWFTVIQLLFLIFYGLCSRLGWIVVIYNRVSEWIAQDR